MRRMRRGEKEMEERTVTMAGKLLDGKAQKNWIEESREKDRQYGGK